MSIARAVSQLNIPSWIVDVRHQASHNHMPSLNLMREAVKFCREWLWKQHWQLPVEQAIVAALPAGQVDGEVAQRNAKIVERIKQALAQFTKWRQAHIRVKKTIGELKMEGPLKNLFDVLEAHPNTVIETLAMPEGLLTMTMEQMKEADIQWRDNYGDGEPKIHAINAKVQGFWEPMMGILSEYGCLVGLLAELARNIGDYAGSDFQLAQLAGWADMILTAFLSADSDVSDYTWKQVLHACVCAPEFFRKEHVMGIVDRLEGKITDKQRRRLLRLFELKDSMAEELPAGPANTSGWEEGEVLDQSTFSIKCLKDLQSRIQQPLPDQSFTNDPLTGEQNWVLCPANACGVLGLTAEQSAESLDLML
ncbi:LAS1-like protein [Aphelenchoides avenae]|nr:LAS1-like protein [Aphelenchus avenae]